MDINSKELTLLQSYGFGFLSWTDIIEVVGADRAVELSKFYYRKLEEAMHGSSSAA